MTDREKNDRQQPDERRFYRVTGSIDKAPLRDHLWHGYEEKADFRHALRQLAERWRGRVGEAVAERNGFLRLRFHDTPGGLPDEDWLPPYLLEPSPVPDYILEAERNRPDPIERELDEAFGFD